MGTHRKLAAIMFTDIVGYSDMMSENEALALETLEQNRRLHKIAIKKFHGEFFKEIGDYTLISFHSALNAVSCAVSLQHELKDNPNLHLRIGIHIGDIVVKSDEVFGDCVNIASKIQSITEPGNICISEHVYSYIYNVPGIEVELLGENRLEGVKQPVKIYSLQYDNFPEELISPSSENPDSAINRFFFWQELKRRKVLKVATGYLAGAFGILEATDILFPSVSIPEWGVILLIITVVLGFIITVYLTWIYELTPEGLKKTEPFGTVSETTSRKLSARGLRSSFSISNIIILALFVMVLVLVYPNIFAKDKFKHIRDDDGRISIAVMPFKNLSADTLYNVWQEGLQNLLINNLTNSKELSVRQLTTMYLAIDNKQDINYASLTPSFASNLSRKLDANTVLLGSILKTGNKIRINAQLLNALTEEIYKTYQVDGITEDDIFTIADSLSQEIKEYFEVKVIIDEFGYVENYEMADANSVEALRYYIIGMKYFINLDFVNAIDWLKKSIEIDSNFVSAYFLTSIAYYNSDQFEVGVEWYKIASKKGEKHSSMLEKLELEWLRTLYFETPYEQIKYIKQILEIEGQSIFYLYLLGWKNIMVHQYNEAIEPLEKAIRICDKLETNHYWVWNYVMLGMAYHELGMHEEESEVYEKSLMVLPENPAIIRQQTVCSLTLGEFNEAEEYLDSYKAQGKAIFTRGETQSMVTATHADKMDELQILAYIGGVYADANMPDSTVKYYRKALEFGPENPELLFMLAYTLIDNEIDVEEGMELIEKALEMDPDNYWYLDIKGWGLYKQSRYKEALAVLTDAWAKRTYYDHEVFLHLQEVQNVGMH